AQLERDALHRRGAVAHDLLADRNRARERDLGHLRASYELGADEIPATDDNVVKTLRESCLVQTLEQDLRLQRAQLTVLDDYRPTAGYCRTTRATDEQQ